MSKNDQLNVCGGVLRKTISFFFILRQVRNKGLINYCENTAYYHTIPNLSITEEKKKNNTHINKTKKTYKQFKTKLSLPTPPRSLLQAVKHQTI